MTICSSTWILQCYLNTCMILSPQLCAVEMEGTNSADISLAIVCFWSGDHSDNDFSSCSVGETARPCRSMNAQEKSDLTSSSKEGVK